MADGVLTSIPKNITVIYDNETLDYLVVIFAEQVCI